MNNRKLIPALVLLLLLTVSLFSQDLDKPITLRFRQAPLDKVLKAVSRESNVMFSYSTSLVPSSLKVTVDARNKPVRKILDEVLAPAGIRWAVVENQVVLTRGQPVKPEQGMQVTLQKAPRRTLAGTVREKGTGEILIGAHIRLEQTSYGAVANTYGYFALTVPAGLYRMTVSFLGFRKLSRDIRLTGDTSLVIEMEEAALDMKEVEITSGQELSVLPAGSLSEVEFSSQNLSDLPGFAGDIDVIRSLQSIPGINSFGDGSAFFYVRGGNSDQNLFMIDDAPIYNPSHLFGFFSAFSPDAVNEMKVYKGDFPAQYGGRLSSVIDIRCREGNMKRFGFSGNIGPYASFLSVEGPVAQDKCSFLVTGRLSTLDWLPEVVPELERYKIRFYDLNAKINLKINPNNRVFLTFFTGNDQFSGFNTTAISTFGIRWNNLAGTLRWNHLFSRKLFANTTASYSRYRYDLFTNEKRNEFWRSSIATLTLKTDFTWFLNPSNTLKAGLEVSARQTDPGNMNVEAENEIRKVSTYQSMEYVLYLSNEQSLGKHFRLRYGVRLPVWQNLGPSTIYAFDVNHKVIDTTVYSKNSVYMTFISPEPRISVRYSPAPAFSITAAYSRNTQFMQILSNSATPFTSLEVWIPSGPNIKPQKSDQVSLGWSGAFLKCRLQVSLDGFYKHYTDHLDYRDHANLLNNPLIEGELRYGTAWSYGLELFIRKPVGKFTGWIAYTYSRSYANTPEVNDGKTYPASFDRPHDFSINLAWKPVTRLSISAGWILLSGGAITTPVGFYYYNGYSVPVYGERNNGHLPAYHRLDLAVEYQLNKPGNRFRHSLVLSVYNVYGRLNPYTVSFNKYRNDQGEFVVPSDQDGHYTLVPTTISVAGVIPSINYQFRF